LVVFQNLFNKYKKEILQARLLMVEGKLQREGEVIHVIVRGCYDLSKLLRHLTASRDEDPPLTLSRADEKTPTQDKRIQQKNEQVKIFPSGRNFR
jgi:error-prone DNA polymerase